MVVAKTQPMFEWLKKQFQGRTVAKTYTALVAGKPVKSEERSRFLSGGERLGKLTVPGAHKRVSGNVGKSRNASTGFKVVKLYDGFTLVEAYPKTGRMHQIRVHFKHIGHPVAGDKTYASKGACLAPFRFRGISLHASCFSFPLPDGTKASFSLPSAGALPGSI